MNGKTDIDPINPCSAEADRSTYGCRWINVSTWGRRLIKIGIFGCTIDVYWTGSWRFMYVRVKNAASVFTPVGSIMWPMPNKGSEGV